MKKNLSLLFVLTSLFSVAQIPTTFTSKGIGGGGALFSPSINPANNNEYYIACDMGELFHTTNFGLSYEQVNYQQLIGGHNSKVCFTSVSGLLYSLNYAHDQVIPVKSTDNGVTWTPLSGNPDNSEEIFSIDVDYNNSNRVIISHYGAIYFSSNGGSTFTNIHNALTGSGNVVGGVLFDGNSIYIGTNDGVLVSNNGGTNWTTASISGIPANESIWSFTAAKSGAITRFYCLTANTSDIYVGLPGSDYYNFIKGIYSVDYGSGNWTQKINGININTDYLMFLKMASNDINTVYAAGSNSNGYPTIKKTSNNGTSWTDVFVTQNNGNIATGWSGQGGDRGWGYGECPFGIAVAPNNSNTVVFGDFGFVHKSSNGGTTWQQAYVNPSNQNPSGSNTPLYQSYQSIGLENTTSWQVHWADATTMWACYSDIRGIRSTDSGNTWSFNYTGNSANSTYRVVQHPVNGTLFAATSNIHDMYQSTRLTDALLDANDPNGKLLYSTNKGATWQDLHVFNHPVFWIALDPVNPNIAYASVIHYNGGAGVGGIYRTTNLNALAGSTWTLLPNPPRTEKHPASIVVLNDGKVVCTYSGRRTTSFTASSGVFLYDPVANSWTDASSSGMHYWTKDIVIDPNDSTQNTWFACVFSGWGGAPNGLGGLYKTTNRGSSWIKLTGSTIDRVTSITFNPNNLNQIFLTTEGQGLWTSSNINAANPTFAMVDAYPFQQPERVFFNPYQPTEMWVTSFGNGMKSANLSPLGVADFTKEEVMKIYPNPTSGIINLPIDLSNQKVSLYDLLGKIVYETTLDDNDKKVNLSHLESGIYILSSGSKKAKVIYNKNIN